MQIEAFDGDYRSIAALDASNPIELESKDRAWEGTVHRWVARTSTGVVASLQARERPDQRLFISLSGEDSMAGALIDHAAAETGRHLHTSVTDTQVVLQAEFKSAGFLPEVQTEQFVVPFREAIAALRHAAVPSGFTMHTAGDVDNRLLFDLDNAVRSRVPGMDGWQGRWTWFAAELEDPAAYLVAIDAGGQYAGFARIWRNDDGPRFGLVGTRVEYRRSRVGPALLGGVLEIAAGWGSKTFTAETALTNRFLYGRLRRVATNTKGLRTQLVRRGSHR